jgi:DNA-binding GntR family transcriptional regulator
LQATHLSQQRASTLGRSQVRARQTDRAIQQKRRANQPANSDVSILNESVYDALKRQILNNRLRPGHKLGHQFLAESLGVSRTPIRESLERLYQEGFVVRVPNRGYYVAEIDAVEAQELYETREALETYELRRSLERGLTKADLAKLDEINLRYKALIGGELTRQRLLIDRDFHLNLAGITGNRFLVRTLATIFERLILKRRVDGYHDTGDEPYAEHVNLLNLLRKGDADAAVRALSGHIVAARNRLLTYLGSMDELESSLSPPAARKQARRAKG